MKCDINQCEQFLKHKNKNKILWNKTNQERINVLLDSFKKYSKSSNTKGLNEKDFTVPFTLWDFYTDFECVKSLIPFSTVQGLLIQNNICSHFANRSTKKLIAKQLKNSKNKNEKFLEIINQAIKYRQK